MAQSGELGGSIVADILGAVGLPGGSVVGTLVSEYVRKKHETARDILLEELRTGRTDRAAAAQQDEIIGALFRYMRAAQEGAARINLRLLAKVVSGMHHRGELVADEFLLFADILAPLSYDEIKVVGMLYAAWKQAAGDPWLTAKAALVTDGMPEEHAIAAVTRAQRSGLVMAVSAYGGLGFQTTSLLHRLGELVDFQDALRREQRAGSANAGAQA